MTPVATRQRFKCDFCKKRSTRSVMEKHERRCFRNPNRFCDFCQNTGTVEYDMDDQYGGLTPVKQPCPYCSKRDPEIEKGIAEYEAGLVK